MLISPVDLLASFSKQRLENKVNTIVPQTAMSKTRKCLHILQAEHEKVVGLHDPQDPQHSRPADFCFYHLHLDDSGLVEDSVDTSKHGFVTRTVIHVYLQQIDPVNILEEIFYVPYLPHPGPWLVQLNNAQHENDPPDSPDPMLPRSREI